VGRTASRVSALLFLTSLALHAQTLDVVPSRVLVDEQATIRATGLQPNERVTIHAELLDGADERWTSHAEFLADAQGAIDTSKQSPASGSYKEVSAMGLIWSMTPSSRNLGRYVPPRNPQAIEFRLERGKNQIATAKLEQVFIADGIQRVELHDGPLRGRLFLPKGSGPHPAVLVLGGSEGGLPSLRAAWLASHGFAALALAYFGYDDLPHDLAGIPLEYFGQALTWMANRPEIVSDHMAVLGTSRGGELALQLATMYPILKATVAYVPANVRYPACCGFTPVPYAWSWTGKALGFRPLRPNPSQDGLVLRSTIEVEYMHGPVLLISGSDDRVWDSSAMADVIVSRLKQHHFAYDVESLKYAHAGHAAGRPEIVPAWQGATTNQKSGREVSLGGTPQGNADSSIDAIPKVIDFLQRNLSPRNVSAHDPNAK